MSTGGEYAKLFKRVWGDPDFKQLRPAEQLLYLKLISQTDVSMAGVLTYATTRWARQTNGLTVADVERTIHALEEARFIACDLDTQEVLIRSYIRNDGGWKSPLTMKGIRSAVERILSPKLRRIISAELVKIDTSGLSEKVSERYNGTVRDYVEGVLLGLTKGYPPLDTWAPDTPSVGVCDTPSNQPNEGVSEGVSDTPSEGVSEGGHEFVCITPAPAPATAPAPAVSPAVSPAPSLAHRGDFSSADADGESEVGAELIPFDPQPARPNIDDDFAAWWELYPRKVGKGQAQKAYRAARKKATGQALAAAIDTQGPLLMARGSQYCPHPATWLNGERWRDEPADLQASDPKRFTRSDWEHLAAHVERSAE